MIDETHDRARRSWVDSANGHPEFPLQNLPFGVFSPRGGPDESPRGGVAIGDMIFDLRAALGAGLFSGEAERAAEAASGGTLNPLMALGPEPRRVLRRQVFSLLDADGRPAGPNRSPIGCCTAPPIAGCTCRRRSATSPIFSPASIMRRMAGAAATRTIRCLRITNTSRSPITAGPRRCANRTSRCAARTASANCRTRTRRAYGPCRNLDYELELAVWIGPGNPQGEPIPIGQAGDHIFGLGLINDWSARDIQYWEMPPLGPFLGKNFGSTVSPWIVTAEALEPFRVAQPPRPSGDPRPLPYLWDDRDQQSGQYDIALEALILTAQMRERGQEPHRMSRSNTTDLYWTVAQLVAHHTCNGCNLLPGDIFGSGTISGPTEEGYGSLSELSNAGTRTITLHNGETRTFLENGDEVIFRARCRRDGYAPIGFGECRARIVA